MAKLYDPIKMHDGTCYCPDVQAHEVKDSIHNRCHGVVPIIPIEKKKWRKES